MEVIIYLKQNIVFLIVNDELSNRGLFSRVSIASYKHEGELGEFETFMQTRDAVEGLHNCREFSQLSLVFR